MKIRTQFSLLLVGVIIIPLISVISLPVYHYLTLPQRHLLKGYKQIRRLSTLDIPEDDWELLREKIADVPPNVQIAVYYDSKVLISSMPELKAGSYLSMVDLFDFIKTSSGAYDYQLQSPAPILRRERQPGGGEMRLRFLVISRSRVPGSGGRHANGWYLPAFLAILVFEAFCITLIIQLSRTIYSSITLLEESTQKIADGALDTRIEMPRRHGMTNEITSLAESLEKMRASLKDDHDRRVKFIMGVSHDLRTPVALIKGYTEAISDGVAGDREALRKSLSIIHDKADQLESMINDLISYVKLNNADWQQSLESVELEPLLEDFARSCAAVADVYDRSIDAAITVRPGIRVPMDRNLFRRALENIFSNALRYTGDGDAITITATDSPADVVISITDTGTGIAEKDLEHIYDLFYRGTNSRREHGMGIGLSVVRTIIDTHGWKIDVQSELGKGTSFVITIPLQPQG